MVNLTALQNLITLSFNSTNLTDTTNIIPNIINTTDSVSQGYFGLVVMTLSFFMIFYITFKQDGDIRSDFMRSFMFATGFSSILGVIMITTTIMSSYSHLLWFVMSFMISILILFDLKRKGL